jgi:hypothetical protein
MTLSDLARISLVALLFLFAGCARSFEAEVTRFHQIVQTGGQTATIVAADPQLEGLEFSSFADIVGHHLERYGYRAASTSTPDLRVVMGYAMAETGSERSGPLIGIGVGHYGRHVGVSYSGLFNVGSNRTYYYAYRLDLVIEEVASGQRIFEGRSVTSGRGANMGAVMPYLVAALFENFPGQSGQTVRIELPVD